MKKTIFIICTVRGADPEYVQKLEAYVASLEAEGHVVHLPHRDTDQTQSGFDICIQNADSIILAHEIHVFYKGTSQGTHFDLGGVFMFNRLIQLGHMVTKETKKLVIVENEQFGEGKSYPRMLTEWVEQQ